MRIITELKPTVIQMAHHKRVAAYARVSSGKDAMLHSLSAQISYYNHYIGAHNDWELAGIYADEAVTGTKEARPEFQRILSDCRDGKIDMVITKSITRFARNTVTLLETVRELKLLGIDVFFEEENIHALSADGELMLTLLASYAQNQSLAVSENMKWRIRKMFQQGRPNTGNMLGYRLVGDTLQMIPEEAETVKQIFSDYLSGMGLEAIMKKLNEMDIKTRTGGKWSKSSLYAILRNEKYIGEMLLQKTYRLDHISKKKMVNRGALPQYHVENSHEAIIEKATFLLVQEEIARRAAKYQPKPVRKKQFLFTGLIRCCQCDSHYRRKINNAGNKYAKAVWICHTFNVYGKDACPSQQIPENILIAKTVEVLGVAELDDAVLRQKIAEIQVPGHNQLVYILKNGDPVTVDWQNPSRRESWDESMKQIARQRQLEIMERRQE